MEQKKYGSIVNYVTSLLFSRDTYILPIEPNFFREQIISREISTLIIEEYIYESDHLWYEKSYEHIIQFCNVNEIEILLIKSLDNLISNDIKGIINRSYNYLDRIPGIKERNLTFNIDINSATNINSKYIDYLYSKIDCESQDYEDFSFENLKSFKELSFNLEKLNEQGIKSLVNFMEKSKFAIIKIDKKKYEVLYEYLRVQSELNYCIAIFINTDFKSFEEQTLYIRNVLNNPVLYHKICINLYRSAFIKNFSDKIDDNISIIMSTVRKKNIYRVVKQLNKQKYVKVELILNLHGFELNEFEKQEIKERAMFHITFIYSDADNSLGTCLNKCVNKCNFNFVTKMDDDDKYLENYLIDLVIGHYYSGGDIIGKGGHFVYINSKKFLAYRHESNIYKNVNKVIGATIFSKKEVFDSIPFSDLNKGEDSDFFERAIDNNYSIFAIHPFEMCVIRYNNLNNHTWKITENKILNNSTILNIGSPEEFLRT